MKILSNGIADIVDTENLSEEFSHEFEIILDDSGYIQLGTAHSAVGLFTYRPYPTISAAENALESLFDSVIYSEV